MKLNREVEENDSLKLSLKKTQGKGLLQNVSLTVRKDLFLEN